MAKFNNLLDEIKRNGYERIRDVVQSNSSTKAKINNNIFSSFSSNDYLGMSSNAEVIKEMNKSASMHGIGTGSSPLITGYTKSHHYLEKELTEYLGTESCIVLNSGYMANLCLLSIFDRTINVIQDKESHNSIIESSKINKVNIIRYNHLTDPGLSIKSHTEKNILFSEAVFSMSGDITNLKNHLDEKNKSDVLLYIDDAHGFAVAENKGNVLSIETTCESFGVQPSDADAYMGTFGKAVGTVGSFICGGKDLIEMIVQKGKPYIYSTSLPRCIIDATRKSLNILASDKSYYEKLHENIKYFNDSCLSKGITCNLNQVPIKTFTLGDPHLTIKVKKRFLEENILVQAIRYPTVPKNQDKIRITLSAKHTKKEIDKVLNTLQNVLCE